MKSLSNISVWIRSSSPSLRFWVDGCSELNKVCRFWVDGCSELNKVRAIYKPRKPPVEGEAKPPQKQARPAGLPPFGLSSVSFFACRLLTSSRVYVLHDCTPLDVVILEISSRKG